MAALASIEGTNNFQDSYSPALGAIISHRIREVVALYAEPIWVNNSNAQPSELVDDNDTFMLGIGARFRFRPTVYVVVEMTPRVSGNAPGSTLTSFAIEKRAGGHMFQLNVGNGNATTPATDRARRHRLRQLVSRLQPVPQVLLRSVCARRYGAVRSRKRLTATDSQLSSEPAGRVLPQCTSALSPNPDKLRRFRERARSSEDRAPAS